ncbi:hypothetical protein NUACC26_031840 [Scytonema sp. NUACC26]
MEHWETARTTTHRIAVKVENGIDKGLPKFRNFVVRASPPANNIERAGTPVPQDGEFSPTRWRI